MQDSKQAQVVYTINFKRYVHIRSSLYTQDLLHIYTFTNCVKIYQRRCLYHLNISWITKTLLLLHLKAHEWQYQNTKKTKEGGNDTTRLHVRRKPKHVIMSSETVLKHPCLHNNQMIRLLNIFLYIPSP